MESWLEVDRAGEIINGVHTALSWHGPPCYLCIEILWYRKKASRRTEWETGIYKLSQISNNSLWHKVQQ